MMDWSSLLDDFGRSLLRAVGEDSDCLPTHYNPITMAIADGDFVERYGDLEGFNRIAISRIATICQMTIYDVTGGPEGDKKPKALRRHWYSWYKTEFAQPFAFQLGDVTANSQGILEMNDLAWTQRLSETYAYFVDNCDVTYKQLWVEDASRMMEEIYGQLFQGCHIIVAVEKDSLLQDFIAPAKALGARSVYSGKGKSSKAATERMLREHFGWSEDWGDPFDYEHPLIVIHISDYDYDGEAVIGPTFAEQARRYTPHILEARVGIQPKQVTSLGHKLDDKWYQVKISNAAYRTWAEAYGLFLCECVHCDNKWPVIGIGQYHCDKCGHPTTLLSFKAYRPHGLEVEALRTRDYYPLLVDALLQILPYDYIIERLRKECKADAYTAVGRIAEYIYAQNTDYQQLRREFDRLEEITRQFEEEVISKLRTWADDHVEDWEHLEENPNPEAFKSYVANASTWSSPWRPFSIELRTAKLVEWLEKNEADNIQEMVDASIEW